MPPTRKRAANAAPVTQKTVEQAHSVLLNLPEKTKDELPMQAAIAQLYPTIVAAIEKGYSLEEVSAFLNKQGIDMNVPSLKYYLSRLKKQQTNTPATKTRKPRQPKGSASTSQEASPPQPAPPASPAPAEASASAAKAVKPSTRRKTTSTAKAAEPAPTAKRRSTTKATKTESAPITPTKGRKKTPPR